MLTIETNFQPTVQKKEKEFISFRKEGQYLCSKVYTGLPQTSSKMDVNISAGNYMFKVTIETLEQGLKYVQS